MSENARFFATKNATVVSVCWRRAAGDVELSVIDEASDETLFSVGLEHKVARSLGYAIIETAAGPA